MNNIKELKKENKSTLKYLHDRFSFDFQKPFVIIKGQGKFTANSIKTCLAHEINGSSEDYEFVLLIRPYNYKKELERFHVAVCDGDRFTVDVPRGYSYDIDTFFNKRDFEETRKTSTAYYYIIAQKKEYLCEQILERHDTTVRYQYFPNPYEMYGDGKGNTYFSRIHIRELHKNSERFEWNLKYRQLKTLSDVIDKSGYLVCEYRSELNRRVCAYKNKKRKAEFLATDYSGTVKELTDAFDKLKTEIASAVMNITDSTQSRLMEKALDRFTWALSYFMTYRKKIADKEYDSKQYAESSEANIRGYIDEAYKALQEAANETDCK